MARQRRESPFFGLKGLKEDESVILLPDVFSPSGSKNVYHDDRARLAGLPGLEKINAGNEIGSSDAGEAVFDFTYESGGSIVRRLLAIFGSDLHYTEIPSPGAGADAPTSVGQVAANTDDPYPSIDSIYDTAYIASGGSNQIRTYDGSSLANAGGSQPTTGSLADGGSAGEHKGVYRLRYRYILADGTLGTPSAASDPLILEERDITATVTNGPGGTLGKMLYLTVGDNETYYYYVGVIDDNTTTTLSIDLTDIQIQQGEEIEESGDAPPTGCRGVTAAKGALWVYNKDGDRAKAWRSGRGKPESFSVLHAVDFATRRGDELMYLLSDFERRGETDRSVEVVAFTRHGVVNLFGTAFNPEDSDPYVKAPTKAPTGTLSGRSVVVLPFQSDNVAGYIGSDKKIYVFEGTTAVPVSEPVQATLDDINMEYAHFSWGVRVPPPIDAVVWFFPTGSTTRADTAVVWQPKEQGNVWHVVKDIPTLGHGCVFQGDDLTLYTIGCQGVAASGGWLYELFKEGENQIDGTNMTRRWRSKPLLGDDGRTKFFDYLDVVAAEAAGVTLTIKVWRGLQDPDTETPFMQYSMSLEDSTVTNVKEIIEIADSNAARLVDEEITVEFSTTSNVDPFRLVGFRIGYFTKQRKRRDR